MTTFMNFIRGILPTMKMLVKLTPTTIDDDIVNIIQEENREDIVAPTAGEVIDQHPAVDNLTELRAHSYAPLLLPVSPLHGAPA